MRPAIILIAATAYVIHMTFGCCFAHGHGPDTTPLTPARHADHGHAHDGHSHGATPAEGPEAPPADGPHDHPSHQHECVSPPASVAKTFHDGGTNVTLDLCSSAIPVAQSGCSIQRMLDIHIAFAPPLRAHLAKLVLTI